MGSEMCIRDRVDAAKLFNINNGNVPMIIRAIIALSIFYGAYIAECDAQIPEDYLPEDCEV